MNKREKLRILAFETPMKAFLRIMSNGGLLLMVTTLIALVWANSPWQDWYHQLFEKTHFSIGINGQVLDMHLLHWINDGLMAIFFFVVGLEIKREMMAGELNHIKIAALPLIAAFGGMVVPMFIYMMFGFDGEASRGWGISMATDIAFSIGILTMLGKRVPLSLKVFLTALAIVDDLGAVLVIAVFYTTQINWLFLIIALALVSVLIIANYLNIRFLWLYLSVGAIIWLLFLHSGVHATIAGVVVALTIPVRPSIDSEYFIHTIKKILGRFNLLSKDAHNNVVLSHEQIAAIDHIQSLSNEVQSPLQFAEHSMHKFINYVVLPLFALANAGIVLVNFGSSDHQTAQFTTISVALAISLVLGKVIGISLFSWLAVFFRLAQKPKGASWMAIIGVSFLGGIGFTMSLFIASLAFPSAAILAEAKLGIFAGSLIAGTIGFFMLKRTLKVN